MNASSTPLPWLGADTDFPAVECAWGENSPAAGLLCAGGDLSVQRLQRAYQAGIFPWFSLNQPILWWSPDPRMVLHPAQFRLHHALKKQIKKWIRAPQCEIRVDSAFAAVIQACATSARRGQAGTWIVPAMVQAYTKLHQAGLAHSVEVWQCGQLIGGLYFVAIGRAVFGESMFHRTTDASKIALAALVAMCCHHGVPQIDCQQNTRHLAFFGAAEIPRARFIENSAKAQLLPAPDWRFKPVYWNYLLNPAAPNP